ncbi:nuclear transport factor 2 family protein [Labrys wisconsinensis]|uniref:Ketosteroid isomerase-like protein n=1 Tax=Labrys wisconsinensis TaxID=425677 RepID=A0ABU0J7N4_9HYPH|nr:nuclear transport factor 2 family protein [Labrys wisconsinensis]MDQ0470291.1 ketosteroid isomerase-like protein [Labrys wisconsinensis]
MSPDHAEALVRRCFDSYRTADRSAIEALLHPDFTFTSPRDDHIGRDAYFERCWPAAGTFAVQDLKTVVPDGSGGCFVLYEGRAKAGWGFRNVEQFRFADGRIVSVEVFFGREPG